MSIFYVENENGTYLSQDGKRKFEKLTGKKAYEYLKSKKACDFLKLIPKKKTECRYMFNRLRII